MLITSSCSNKRGVNGEQIIGLYKATETTCNVPEFYKADCESVRFIELVKGQFYGVNDDEIAFVTWQGDLAGELLYLARKTPLANIKNFTGAQLGLENENSTTEYFEIRNNKIVTYHYASSANDDETGKHYRYQLQLINRSAVTEYQMDYPDLN